MPNQFTEYLRDMGLRPDLRDYEGDPGVPSNVTPLARDPAFVPMPDYGIPMPMQNMPDYGIDPGMQNMGDPSYTPAPFAAGYGAEPAPFTPTWGGQGSRNQMNPVTEQPRGQAVQQGRGLAYAPGDAPAVSGPADVSGPAGQAITAYIIKAAQDRGIDPQIALQIADREGSRDRYEGREGVFPTGKSYWAYQLHYGGAGTPYASWGDTAGMGNDFTERTGYKPGDPAAWQAAIDFALDRARKTGWGPWYGRNAKPGVHREIGEFEGIPR